MFRKCKIWRPFCFFMSFFYCKTSNPLISTFVSSLRLIITPYVISVAYFKFYPPKNRPMYIRSKKNCVASPDHIQDRDTKIFW